MAEVNKKETKRTQWIKDNEMIKSDKTLAKLIKERPKFIKLEMKKGIWQQIPKKSKISLGNMLRFHIPVNWKT
jgi:hypothetical protein